jgi:hypothetical protein
VTWHGNGARRARAAGAIRRRSRDAIRGTLTIGELRSLVAAGEVDTVVIAITDMQGRLQGKRCAAKYLLDVVG